MIIFLYGQDTYRLRQKLREIREHYQKAHPNSFNLKYFNGQELAYQDFQNESGQISMFPEKKLFVVDNIDRNEEFQKRFLENGSKFLHSGSTIVFYQEEEPASNEFFKFLVKNAKSQKFDLFSGLKLRNWARKEFEQYGLQISPQLLTSLINSIGNNLWQFSNEIRKLASYKKNKRIEAKDLEILVRPEIETNIFKTVDAIALRNKRQALSLIHQHLEKGDNPLYLLSMINFQFRNLLMVKTSQNVKLHPYVLKKTSWQAPRFTLEELKKIYHKLFEIDYALKTGRSDPQTALDLFISGV